MYRIKLFFAKIRWYFDTINYAREHEKAVDNYKFLVSLRKNIHNDFLEFQRVDSTNPELIKLETQIELIDKILDYTNGKNR